MQPTLVNGTLLQNRFRIVEVLGQGGCGRTYLATDEQRFQERCAIKEFFPSASNSAAAAKSRELFYREAELLYQIQHPQIPQFRALFEEADRFFFAQDFVAGRSYHELWQERLDRGMTFTEDEVLDLLARILPILSYLHQQNIIHRDKMPVLIDFGVGKQEITTGADVGFPFGTMVGKAGYAPIEQLKTGKVYPNSDLYALAVSAIVLLAGKTPGDLFDEMSVNWLWRIHAPDTSQRLATILDRIGGDGAWVRWQSSARSD